MTDEPKPQLPATREEANVPAVRDEAAPLGPPMSDPQPMPPTRRPSTRGDLQQERLRSEDVIINAPMSFAGSAQRAWRIGREMTGAKKALVVAFVILPIIGTWWMAIATWYVMFGLLLVPYRLLRRGARKRTKEALRHRELMDTIQRQQQK
jgi:hypothetical protein